MKLFTLATVTTLSLAAGCGDDISVMPTPDNGGADPDAPPASPVTVQVLAFNDFHGNLEPPQGGSGRVVVGVPAGGGQPMTVDAGGATYFAAKIAALRAEQPNTLVVSAGDMIGASPLLSAAFHDEPTIEVMNELGLDFAGVGNHEFDEGSSELLRMQYGGCHPGDGCLDGDGFAGADFQFLSANVAVDGPDGRTLFPRYAIKEVDGIPIAFIGMTLEDTPSIVTPLGVGGLVFRDEASTVNELVPVLRAAGVKAIVVVIHEGGFQTGLYNECTGISGAIVDIVERLDDEVDLVVSGHTHAAYNCEIDGKRVTSALSFGRLVTKITMQLDPASHDVTSIAAENVIATRDRPSVTAVDALVARYTNLIAPLRDRVVGQAPSALTTTATPSGESTMGLVVADAQLAATSPPPLGGAQIALMNPGGVRAGLDAGDVTFGEIFTVQPFGNSLVTMTLTGAQLDAVLEQQFAATTTRILQPSQGFTYTVQRNAPIGSRVDPSSMRLDGVPVEPTGQYRVTVNSFLASGGDGFTVLNQGTNRLGGAVDLDALEAYLKDHTPLVAPAVGRITVSM